MALSVVHFKFKSQVDYDSVSFDGPVVTVGELKALIAERTGMGVASASEIVLSDPRSSEEFRLNSALIPNASSVLVRRAPQAAGGAGGGTRSRRGKAAIGVGPSGEALAAAEEKTRALPAPRLAIARPVPLPRIIRSVAHGGPSRSELMTYADPYAASKKAGKDAAAAAVIAGGGGGGAAAAATNEFGNYDEANDDDGGAGGGGEEEQDFNDEDAALQSMLASTGSTWKAEVAEAARMGRGRGRGRGGRGGEEEVPAAAAPSCRGRASSAPLRVPSPLQAAAEEGEGAAGPGWPRRRITSAGGATRRGISSPTARRRCVVFCGERGARSRSFDLKRKKEERKTRKKNENETEKKMRT